MRTIQLFRAQGKSSIQVELLAKESVRDILIQLGFNVDTYRITLRKCEGGTIVRELSKDECVIEVVEALEKGQREHEYVLVVDKVNRVSRDEDTSFDGALCVGLLEIQIHSNWVLRWWVLQGDRLYWHHSKWTGPAGCIDVGKCAIRWNARDKEFELDNAYQLIKLRARNDKEMEQWIYHLACQSPIQKENLQMDDLNEWIEKSECRIDMCAEFEKIWSEKVSDEIRDLCPGKGEALIKVWSSLILERPSADELELTDFEALIYMFNSYGISSWSVEKLKESFAHDSTKLDVKIDLGCLLNCIVSKISFPDSGLHPICETGEKYRLPNPTDFEFKREDVNLILTDAESLI